MTKSQTFDVAVVGAGVFGSWIGLHLARRGQRVVVLDAYGPANSRASSGGESRIIRMGYGPDELYTRWAIGSLSQWKELFGTSSPAMFHETGVLWVATDGDAPLAETTGALTRCKVPFETLDAAALTRRYPQFSPQNLTGGILETTSGVLMGRHAVAAVLERAVSHGAEYRHAKVAPISTSGAVIESIATSDGRYVSAGHVVFACGAWLGKIFPELLGPRIFPSRQEVFFFGVPAGDSNFNAAALPTWLIPGEQTYGMPDLESRGFKVAFDGHGQLTDPDSQHRVVSQQSTERMRSYVAERFPALRDSPIVETRVCQYENTSNGDFLIDRHPQIKNVWFAGGGSGHGFKHGPMVGEYVARQLLDGGETEIRFALANKGTQQRRAIY